MKDHPLLSVKYCDNCGTQHSQSDLSLVSKNDDTVTFQLVCTKCDVVQLLRMAPGGAIAIQRFESNNSDVKGGEFKRFAGKPSIDKDEALDVYVDMEDVEDLSDFLDLVEGEKVGRKKSKKQSSTY